METPRTRKAFAVWVTGIPASGKSTLTRALVRILRERFGLRPQVLESDALRREIVLRSVYHEEERVFFYGVMVHLGVLLVEAGIPVIFDATAHRRRYRERARWEIPRFLEVWVDCPLAVCMQRDPKGLYRRAQQGSIWHLPGLQDPYEPPEAPDVVVCTMEESPEKGAEQVVARLVQKGWLGN